MGKKEVKNKLNFINSLLQCSSIAATTFERMEELISQTLYFLPNFEERSIIMKQYYENVHRFIDEISFVLANSVIKDNKTLFMYETFFTYLKEVSSKFYLLHSFFSIKQYELSNIAMDELISLNKTVSYSVNFFVKEVANFSSKKEKNDKSWHLGELEFAVNEHIRLIQYNVLSNNYSWQQAELVVAIAKIMGGIANIISKALRILPFLKE
ncbi:MAG: hypothetical protein K9W45_12845 [Candidatus Heimdallarchaeum aukensis]|uniref:Uncharacterized protein n=1 Tax=Candidatus Heimdallarchaeum aukensis TaxID=2876573 RepID=A0A9Y1FLL8_9ARCH|nr:MAG: hypothetical protein K9W45_12845 [Candidatus Heimdallarchaeum aukensis]